jgi:hypothetical protein
MRDAILVRVDPGLTVLASGGANYATRFSVGIGQLSYTFLRGYAWADVRVGAKTMRFIDTHLESEFSVYALGQANELLAGPAATDKSVTVACDCNSDPLNDNGKPPLDPTPHSAPYDLIVGHGFTDQWLEFAPAEEGWTSGLSELVDDPTADGFDHRIDMIFARPAGQTPAWRRGHWTRLATGTRRPGCGHPTTRQPSSAAGDGIRSADKDTPTRSGPRAAVFGTAVGAGPGHTAVMRAPSEVCPHCAGLVPRRHVCVRLEWNRAVRTRPARSRHRLAVGRPPTGSPTPRPTSSPACPDGRSAPGWSLARLVMVAISVVLLAARSRSRCGIGDHGLPERRSSSVCCWMVALMLRPRFGKLDSAARPQPIRRAYSVRRVYGRRRGCARRPHTVAIAFQRHGRRSGAASPRPHHRPAAWVTPQQRAALLAHEMGQHGDPSRGLLTQPAFSTLIPGVLTAPIPSTRRRAVRDRRLGRQRAWRRQPLFRLAHIMLVVAGLRDKRRAEYLADEVSARVAGSAAAVELIDILAASEEVRFAIRWAAGESALVTDWRAAAQAGRPAGRSRTSVLRQLSVRDEASLFASHPPAGLRARLIESRPPELGSLAVNEAEAIRIDTELAKHYAQVRRTSYTRRLPAGERLEWTTVT